MLAQKIKKSTTLLAALSLIIGSVAPLLVLSSASAYGLLADRQIKLDNSTVSASGVGYEVTFKAGTSATVKSVAIDFCANSPIINDTCTASPGTTTPTITSATVTTTGGVNNFSASTWTVAYKNTNRTITLTNASGVALTAGNSYTFTLNALTNQSTNGTFYSRILTFPNDVTSNYADGYTGTNVATNVPTDAGGIALSLASQITVTSKVQERLTFCVYTGANCGAGGSAVTLGNTNGVLDSAGPYVDKTTKYDVSTNAASGVAIRIKGDTLKAGTNSIAAIGATATASALGTEQFGFCNYQSTGSGLTPASPYNDSNCSSTTQTAGTGSTGGNGTALFAFDSTNTVATYGQVFANKVAGASSTGVIAFIGNISNTTPAGIYTTTLTFIATGTY